MHQAPEAAAAHQLIVEAEEKLSGAGWILVSVIVEWITRDEFAEGFGERFSCARRRQMADVDQVQYVSDASGNTVSVIVPIDLWKEIESEKETAYLLKSDAMKRRLLEAKERQEGIPIEEAREKLGF